MYLHCLQNYITGRLNTSALDAAVSALSAKADGLFLYAFLLEQHLDMLNLVGCPC